MKVDLAKVVDLHRVVLTASPLLLIYCPHRVALIVALIIALIVLSS